ncbi:MAG: hypothetical protein BWK76_25605 [Desulfobulbaceae bacterium A2]|nr:MAG: hypothetical protein BWK76_25605 [Desulfobulbaceae bacterium A2]
MGLPPAPLLQLLQRCSRVVLVPHVRPDGDALGSMLGLTHLLASQGKMVLPLIQGELPPLYHFLPGSDLAQAAPESLDRFFAASLGEVAVVALDCGDASRLGVYAERLLQHHPLAVIDHHRSNGGFGDICWIEPDRSSTGEMVYDLAMALGWTITAAAAQCLYTAILTDTGSFRYETTSPHTFAVAGELLAAGVRPEEVATRIFDTSSLGRLRLLQLALGTLRLDSDGRVASIEVSRGMYTVAGANQHDTEDFVNWPRSLASVEVSLFCREVEEEPDTVSVSLRAKGGCDVAAVATRFGGGGHRNAAGFRQRNVQLAELRQRVVEEVAGRLQPLAGN